MNHPDHPPLRRTTTALLALLLVISPLLTSAVVRTYGWIAILAENGLVNNALAALGLAKLKLMFNATGVTIGLTEILMPYMILALLAGFGRLDPRVEDDGDDICQKVDQHRRARKSQCHALHDHVVAGKDAARPLA